MSKWRDLQAYKDDRDWRCGLPPGFFRLRYFHGKQMRLADYVDEQRYHMGKMRFHNEKLHGAGILCGLKVAHLEQDGVSLRVARGAALDDCGREIVVGYDQCINVDDWFQVQKRVVRETDHDPCQPDSENKVRLCVVIRYAECVGAPEPAPAVTCGPPSGCECGCDGPCTCATPCPDPCNDSAEFGRVTEEFELKLMFWDDAKRLSEHDLFPPVEDIDRAVAEASGGIGLLQSLAHPIRQRCPQGDGGWLLLACFDAVLDDDDGTTVVEIRNIDHECASQVLLSTEVIQYLLAGLFAEVDPNIGGPEIASIDFRKLDAQHYQFILTLTGPIDEDSLGEDDNFDIRWLSPAGWKLPAGNAVTAEYKTTASGEYIVEGPAIYIKVDNSAGHLVDGGRYHLFMPAGAHPVVDTSLRHLRPRNMTWRFKLQADSTSGDLVMIPLPTTP